MGAEYRRSNKNVGKQRVKEEKVDGRILKEEAAAAVEVVGRSSFAVKNKSPIRQVKLFFKLLFLTCMAHLYSRRLLKPVSSAPRRFVQKVVMLLEACWYHGTREFFPRAFRAPHMRACLLVKHIMKGSIAVCLFQRYCHGV